MEKYKTVLNARERAGWVSEVLEKCGGNYVKAIEWCQHAADGTVPLVKILAERYGKLR